MVPVRSVAVVGNISRPFNRRIVQGVAAYVRQIGGWRLRVAESPLETILDRRHWQGDGIIADFHDPRVAADVRQLTVPIVATGGGGGWYGAADAGIPYLATDNRAIAQLAARHLYDQGFRHFAYCGYTQTKLTDWSTERADALRSYVEQIGHTCDVFLAPASRSNRWSDPKAGLPAWLAGLPRPVGVMACNDGCAQRVLDACRIVGLTVPGDLGLVGVDNDEMMCELTDPPLTSIEQGSRQLGYEAAATLELLMDGRRPPALRRVIEPERLVERASTDMLPMDDLDLRAAVAFVRRHACDPIQVGDVLHHAQLSRSTMERKFRSALGRSIHGEIRRVQLAQAKQLLAQGELSIKQVARRCGFRTVQYLWAVFREATGRSPSEYRRAKLRGLPNPGDQ